jgi:phospholipid-binding lipoprotein MlaA
MKTHARSLAIGLAVVLLAGCATVPPGGKGVDASQASDPWETFNRKVFSFNDTVDNAVLKPVATAYRDVVPELVRSGVNNVFSNIRDVWSTANHFLQGKLQSGMEMGMRVLTNSLLGLGGVLDPASEMGLTRRSEDLGQTLGKWGFANGPYLVLPLLGPSTIRDSINIVGERTVSPSSLPDASAAGRYAVTALELVNARAGLLSTTQLLDQVALDRYAFVRDAYLSRRRDALYDGAPPMETFDDEPASDAKPAQ